MPRPAQFRIQVIEELLRQLTYAPPETRRRQMDAAERLIDDIDPQQNYPEDFIVYRITGYRRDHAEEPVTLVGQALLPDLVNLVQRLSDGLDLDISNIGRQPLPIETVARRLNVSHKTVQRYRRQGLVCHWLKGPDGIKRLVCFEDALQRFAAMHADRLKHAATFSRINGETEQSIIQRARELRACHHHSLNEAAKQIAHEVGRAHETIRMLLRRHDRHARQPIFSEPGALTQRDVRLIHRAWQRGIEPALIAQRMGKSKPAIHRAINRARADALRAIRLAHIHLPTFDLPDADRIILGAPCVNRASPPPGVFSLPQWLQMIAEPSNTLASSDVDAVLAAINLLSMRTERQIAALPDQPTSAGLDQIETNLRWVAALRQIAIAHVMPGALTRIEQHLGRPITSLPMSEVVELLRLAVQVTRGAIETVDPGRGQKLERIAGFALEKALAQSPLIAQRASSRAAIRRPRSDSSLLRHPYLAAQTWENLVTLRCDLQPFVPMLPDTFRQVVEARYGLRDKAPQTTQAIASIIHTTPIRAARLAHQAMRELRRLARDAANSLHPQ